MKVVSYVDKFVFQVFRETFAGKKKNESIHSSSFLDSFQFPGKIASNIFQILNLDFIYIALRRSPIYMFDCDV